MYIVVRQNNSFEEDYLQESIIDAFLFEFRAIEIRNLLNELIVYNNHFFVKVREFETQHRSELYPGDTPDYAWNLANSVYRNLTFQIYTEGDRSPTDAELIQICKLEEEIGVLNNKRIELSRRQELSRRTADQAVKNWIRDNYDPPARFNSVLKYQGGLPFRYENCTFVIRRPEYLQGEYYERTRLR